jgi:nodulation protein A
LGQGIVLTVEWSAVREGTVSLDDHAALGVLLRAAYPHFPEHFAGMKTWSYIRPEARAIGWDNGSAVATAGVLRRFIQISSSDQLVAIVGLVAVHPDRQRSGVGQLLMHRVSALLDFLGVPFGLLMCAERHTEFYRRCGWHQLPPCRVVYSPDDTQDARAFVDQIAATVMVLPVRAELRQWPAGDMKWHCASV